MPRKRRTKLTKRTKPKLPDEDSAYTMSEEEEKAKLESFLKDFDIEVEKRVKAMRSQMKTMCSTIHQAFNLEILRLPSHVRDMKRSQFFGEKEADQIKEEFSNSVDQLLASSLSQLKSAPPVEKDGNGETLQDGTSTQNRKGRTRKKTAVAKKRTVKATTTTRKKRITQDENNPPATATRSTRQSTRSTRASARKQQQFETPANTASLSQLGYDTPFMTPKFDPRLPITPAMARLPKRGEHLMSKTGSPVINDCPGALGNSSLQMAKESSIRDTLQKMDEDEVEKLLAEELKEASLDANSRKLICSKLHVLMDRILKNTADS